MPMFSPKDVAMYYKEHDCHHLLYTHLSLLKVPLKQYGVCVCACACACACVCVCNESLDNRQSSGERLSDS